MELKCNKQKSVSDFFSTFNRTAYGIEMAEEELTQDKFWQLLIAPLMELKLKSQSLISASTTLLIAPLMELK